MNGIRIEIDLFPPHEGSPWTRGAAPPLPAEYAWGPGELLQGEFHVANCSGRKLRAAECSVLWYTVGKGDEDLHVHDLLRIELESERPNVSACTKAFSFTLPPSPQTYDGVIVKIRWCVRVRVFLAGGQEVASETPIVLGSICSARLAEPISELTT